MILGGLSLPEGRIRFKAKSKLVTNSTNVAFLLAHLNAYSHWVRYEQKKLINQKTKQLLKELTVLTSTFQNGYCVGTLASCKDSLLTIMSQPLRDFDFSNSIKSIDEIKLHLKEGCELLKLIDETCQQIETSLTQSASSQNPEVISVANEIQEGFYSLVQQLSKVRHLNLNEIADIYRNLVELNLIARELKNDRDFSSPTEGSWIDYYQVLGIPKTATKDEIRLAFRSRSSEYHPDTKAEQVDRLSDEIVKAELINIFNERMRIIIEAYETLKDPNSRSLYDMQYEIRRGERSGKTG